jgi:hypothetical protein
VRFSPLFAWLDLEATFSAAHQRPRTPRQCFGSNLIQICAGTGRLWAWACGQRPLELTKFITTNSGVDSDEDGEGIPNAQRMDIDHLEQADECLSLAFRRLPYKVAEPSLSSLHASSNRLKHTAFIVVAAATDNQRLCQFNFCRPALASTRDHQAASIAYLTYYSGADPIRAALKVKGHIKLLLRLLQLSPCPRLFLTHTAQSCCCNTLWLFLVAAAPKQATAGHLQ